MCDEFLIYYKVHSKSPPEVALYFYHRTPRIGWARRCTAGRLQNHQPKLHCTFTIGLLALAWPGGAQRAACKIATRSYTVLLPLNSWYWQDLSAHSALPAKSPPEVLYTVLLLSNSWHWLGLAAHSRPLVNSRVWHAWSTRLLKKLLFIENIFVNKEL